MKPTFYYRTGLYAQSEFGTNCMNAWTGLSQQFRIVKVLQQGIIICNL